jgi:pimeloyl-ACP methyl ester carboxylesterase
MAAAVRDEMVEVWDSRLRLHVKIAGDGPPLLFFHSLAGLAWQPLLDRLAGLGRRLHRIQVPTLIVWGREDALVPVGYAKEFGRRIAGSRVEVLDDCGHVVQADQPERSWTAISRFLAS